MKHCIPTLVRAAAILMTTHSAIASEIFIQEWGLESPKDFYKEDTLTAEKNAEYWPESFPDDYTFRFFTTNREYFEQIMPLFERAGPLYDKYLLTGGARDRNSLRSSRERTTPIGWIDSVIWPRPYILTSLAKATRNTS